MVCVCKYDARWDVVMLPWCRTQAVDGQGRFLFKDKWGDVV